MSQPTANGTGGQEPSTDPLANRRVLIDRAPCFSLRHGRNDVDSVKRDVEFGIILTERPNRANKTLEELYSNPPSAQEGAEGVVSADWLPGDVVQCYWIVEKSQSVEWFIDDHSANE